MRLRVLGCSGGIGGRHLRTTSFLVDSDILLDAGSGVGDLSLAELTQIDHIFVTHSHLDHVTSIPFLVDTVGGMRTRPITVYATAATIEILKNHLFNWAIWPDFTEIPTTDAPFMRYHEVELGRTVTSNQIADHLAEKFPGRFQASTALATGQRLASSWSQAGYLRGKVNKKRAKPHVTSLVAAYAVVLGYLRGLRGKLLLDSTWTRLLDCSPTVASKEARKFALHFGAEAPATDGTEIPVWIRDGWEVDLRATG